MQQDHTLALTNLATATQDDRTSVTLHTMTISELSGKVALLTENLPQCSPRTRERINQGSNQPQLGMYIGRPATRPLWSRTQVKIANYIIEADRGSTQMGTAPPMDTRWRSPTRQRRAVFQVMVITS